MSGILKRIGMGKLGRLGLEPAQRYERARPGELIHIDVKKLGRIKGGAGKRVTGGRAQPSPHRTDAAGVRRNTIGWEAVHVAIDDATRLAYVEVLADEKADHRDRRSCAARSRSSRATASPSSDVITDNGSPYRSTVHAARLPRPRHPPPPHPALPTPNQRQSRTLHPHPARRLGLRRDLRHQPRTHRSP